MSDNTEQQNAQPEMKNCIMGCGFWGSAQTNYMCSKCFKDAQARNRASLEAPLPPKAAVESPMKVETVVPPVESTPVPDVAKELTEVPKGEPTSAQKKKTRCNVCNKKVGLTGIECRCELVFCGLHRYPEQHNCSFDFKAHDRASLAQSVVGGGNFSKIDHV